jgi:hypothetical protein
VPGSGTLVGRSLTVSNALPARSIGRVENGSLPTSVIPGGISVSKVSVEEPMPMALNVRLASSTLSPCSAASSSLNSSEMFAKSSRPGAKMLLAKVSMSVRPSAEPKAIEVALKTAGSYSTSRSNAATISPLSPDESPETMTSTLNRSPTNPSVSAGRNSIATAFADCDANVPARSAAISAGTPAAANLLMRTSPLRLRYAKASKQATCQKQSVSCVQAISCSRREQQSLHC